MDTNTLASRSAARRRVTALAFLLVGVMGCKERHTICDHPLYFRQPTQPKGSPAISLAATPYGPIVPAGKIIYGVDKVFFDERGRVTASFWSYDVSVLTELSFSPSEEKAYPPNDPTEVYRMARFWDGNRERVRFGFRTAPCMDEDNAAFFYCSKFGEEVDLVSEMTCRDETRRERPRWPRLRWP
jgi:hypothetical protein